MQTVLDAISLIEDGWKSQKFKLFAAKLGIPEMELIYQTFLRNDTLKSLEIILSEVQEDHLAALIKGLQPTPLQGIKLIHLHLTERTAIALATAVQASSIRAIDLTYNDIGPRGAIALANALRDSGIESLLLARNSISVEATQYLAQVLSEGSTSLKALDLSKNYIGDAGAIALAKALPHTKLETLLVDMNEITKVGVAEICKAVKSTRTLVNLSLGVNNLTDPSAKLIAELIRTHPMEKVSVNHNQFTKKGVAYLADAIAESITLEHLDLRGNRKITNASAVVGLFMTSSVTSF